MTALALPQADLAWLRRRVANFAEDRPGVYRMVGPNGRVLYVGKAKRLRTRLLSYFRARYPEDKAARIIHAASDVEWHYQPSEFAALLEELRQIQRFRPAFNVRMNRQRQTVLIRVTGGPAPKIVAASGKAAGPDTRHYGPFPSLGRAKTAVKVLNDLLGLRDCALSMPIVFAEQGDLFAAPRRAACLRHELGNCLGPCAGHVDEPAYLRNVGVALGFLDGRHASPLDRVVEQMNAAADAKDYERAVWWRERFEALEWLFTAQSRARSTIESLSFVYLDPGAFGNDMAYLIRRARVRASAPAPRTPIEREAFRALIESHGDAEPESGPLPAEGLDEMLLIMRWFRAHPSAMRRTVPIGEWLDRNQH